MLNFLKSEKLKIYLLTVLVVGTFFSLLYGFTNYWGARQTNLYHLWLPFELSIPLVPEFIVIYFSMLLLNLGPLFFLDSKEILRLGMAMLAAIVIASLIFFFFPAPTGFHRHLLMSNYRDLFAILYEYDNSTNTFPSLHVGLSFLTVRSLHNKKQNLNFLWVWFGLICLSVIFTHQHHLVDIFGGIIVGEICFQKFFLRIYFKFLDKLFFQNHRSTSPAKPQLSTLAPATSSTKLQNAKAEVGSDQ